MAHKGRPWKVALRRDLNLNVQTYNHGLAHSYDVHFNPFIGSDPNDLNNADFHPVEGVVTIPDGQVWLDTNVHHGSSVFDLSMQLTVASGLARATRILTVSRHGTGIIYQAQYGPANDTQSNWLVPGVAVLVFDLSFFGTKGFDQFPVIAPTPY